MVVSQVHLHEARTRYAELHQPWRERAPEARYLLARPVRGGSGPGQVMVDPLLMGVPIREVEWDDEE